MLATKPVSPGGAVYVPCKACVEIVPTLELPSATALTVQVTAVSPVSVTCNVVTPPVAMAALSGEIEIVTCAGGGGGSGFVPEPDELDELQPPTKNNMAIHNITPDSAFLIQSPLPS